MAEALDIGKVPSGNQGAIILFTLYRLGSLACFCPSADFFFNVVTKICYSFTLLISYKVYNPFKMVVQFF